MHIAFLLRGGVRENVTQEIFKVMLEILVSKTANYRVSHNLCQTSSDNLKTKYIGHPFFVQGGACVYQLLTNSLNAPFSWAAILGSLYDSWGPSPPSSTNKQTRLRTESAKGLGCTPIGRARKRGVNQVSKLGLVTVTARSRKTTRHFHRYH